MDRSRSMSILKKRKIAEESKNFVLKRVKLAFRDDPEKYHRFLRIVAGASRSGISRDSISIMSRDLKTLFTSRPDLVVGFNRFLPIPYQIPLPAPAPNLDLDLYPGLDLDRFGEFLEEVRSRFDGDGDGDGLGIYNKFLSLLSQYNKGEGDEVRVCSDVCELFHGHDDLQRFFNSLFSGFVEVSQRLENQGLALFKRVRAKIGNEGYLKFLKSFFEHSKGLITGVELGMNVFDLGCQCPLILEELNSFLIRSYKETQKRPVVVNDQIPTGFESEQDSLGDNPSYRALQVKHPRRGQRLIFGDDEVLNDTYECEYRGGGEFKHELPKTKEKKMLQEWDEKFFNLDFQIHLAASTTEKAVENLEILRKKTRSVRELRLFPETGLRCIKNMYKDKELGESVVKAMLEDPLRHLPVVIDRLLEKEKEWKEEMNEMIRKKPNFRL